MKKNALLFAIVMSITLPNHSQTVTDIDGNIYHTISIDKQVWMIENLRTTRRNE